MHILAEKHSIYSLKILPIKGIDICLMACYNSEALKDRGIAQLVEQRSPKPRAEGSNPSAPAKDVASGKSDKARNSKEFRAFLVFWGGGLRSTMPLSMACVLRFFRFCSYPFLAFPSGTSSINHQKSGALSLVPPCSR